jgi:ribonuclease HI
MNEVGITVHTDGGARGNPGPAACAFIIDVDGKRVYEESDYLGNTTNNVAEYHGVLHAITWLSSNHQKLSQGLIVFYLDSELVVRQLNGVYKVKDKTLSELFFRIKEISKNIDQKIFYKHVPRTANKEADLLVNKELDKSTNK